MYIYIYIIFYRLFSIIDYYKILNIVPDVVQQVLVYFTYGHDQSLSHVQLFATPWTVARQAPLSMGFPRQEYWNGLPFPLPGDLPDPGIEPTSPAQAGGFFTAEPPGKPVHWFNLVSWYIYFGYSWLLNFQMNFRMIFKPQANQVGVSFQMDQTYNLNDRQLVFQQYSASKRGRYSVSSLIP